MAQRLSGGIVALLIIAALAVGGIIGYLLPRGADHDTSAEGRIDYACEIAADMQDDGGNVAERLDSETDAVIRDIMTIASLLGGPSLQSRDDATEEQLMGSDLYGQMSRVDVEGLQATVDDLTDYCRSR